MKQSIGIFDSGVGGLSIYLAVKKILPKENFVYLADQKNCPYGEKTEELVKKFSFENTKFLLTKNCKLIIIACNTATTIAIKWLRKKFPKTPFVGVVPVIKFAAKKSLTGHFIILSTKITQKSKYLKQLINNFAQNKIVYNLSCPFLVKMIDRGIVKGERINFLLKSCLKEALKDKKIDVFGIGCTHYFFIQEEIINLFPYKIKFIKAGSAVAQQVKRILRKNKIISLRRYQDRFFTTGNSYSFETTFQRLLGFKIKAEKVKL